MPWDVDSYFLRLLPFKLGQGRLGTLYKKISFISKKHLWHDDLMGAICTERIKQTDMG